MEIKKLEHSKGVFTLDNFLTSEECDDLIVDSEARGYDVASIQARFGAKVVADVRNNERILFDDSELAKNLFSRLMPFLPPEITGWTPSGLNERFRFYKYIKNQYFKWHVDGYFIRDPFEASKLTLIIYMSDDCEGGETEFESFKVSPKKGMALVFPHKLRHQGSEIISGVKYVLRSDVMYAK